MIDGTVERITPYGAFLKLEDGRLGLVHISEIDRNYVKDVHEHLREGDVVQAKVRAIKEDGKIDLSIKALQDPAPPRPRRGSDPGSSRCSRSSCVRARSAWSTTSARSSTSASSGVHAGRACHAFRPISYVRSSQASPLNVVCTVATRSMPSRSATMIDGAFLVSVTAHEGDALSLERVVEQCPAASVANPRPWCKGSTVYRSPRSRGRRHRARHAVSHERIVAQSRDRELERLARHPGSAPAISSANASACSTV